MKDTQQNKETQGNKVYLSYVDTLTPRSKPFKTLALAFVVGGVICMVGQAVGDILKLIFKDISPEILSGSVSAIMIFIGATLTGVGLYDNIGSFAGAGSVIPITGFANSVVSPAIEFKSEGLVYGLCAKMFTIAGPIIVNGVTLSALVGLIYYILAVCGVAI